MLVKDDLPHKENCRHEARQANQRSHLRVFKDPVWQNRIMCARGRVSGRSAVSQIVPHLEAVEDGEIAHSRRNEARIRKISFWCHKRKEINQKRGGTDEILGSTAVKSQ